ncbi:putative reverse transcriptase domain-containing protein [Tanacetum coccineum]|uniref:Reverse transcriptase domain-containing protein n=1 Tax=Tanacetum coccineum TaxID=301880 RepID=A0ABQ4X9Y0_9ASTR
MQGHHLGYRAAGIRMRAAVKRCLITPGPTPEVDTWDEIVEAMMEIAPTTLEGVDQRVTELDTTVRQRTEEFQVRFEEAYDDRAYLGALVNTLYRDRPYHRHTALALDREAVYARIAWTSSEERSAAIEAHVRTLEAQVATLIAQTTSLQTQLTTALGRIATLEARDPEPQDGPAEAGSSCVAVALAEHDASRSRDGDNSHGSGTGGRRQDAAYAMPRTALKRMITDKYCPKGEIKKLRSEYWNLRVRAKVERYVGGLPDMIHGNVKASKPQSMQEAIVFATEMMDKKMLTMAERQAENKRKFEDTSRNNQNQQQPFKRNNVAWAYTAGPGDKKPYGGTKPLCTKCNYHHNRPCAQKCTNCKKIGHLARDCHFRSDCPRLKNGNQGNRAGNGNAIARAYVVGSAGTNPNSNVITGTFLLNNRYASILFDTGADRSFISTAFSSLIDIIPTTLDHDYDVELADDRII